VADFAGKVAIVTGASGGIGRAYALALAGAGATVVAAARSIGDETATRGTLAEVVQACAGMSGRIAAMACDVTVEADVARLAAQTAANFGRIDVLVNNAGAYPSHPSLSISEAEWDGLMKLNLHSAYLAMREAVPHMIRAGWGSVVNITAGASGAFPNTGGAHPNLLLYALTKAGINRLTTFMADELRPHGIAVNALSPGVVRTDIWDTLAGTPGIDDRAGKPATPEVLGPALLHLAAQDSSGLTGQVLHTDAYGIAWP
jgi:3-oxoacyl-[acyl-carrier protein] reductase